MFPHKLLLRQLNRLGLTMDTCPLEIEKWQALLKSIDTAYCEADQERAMLERSMVISSREMSELNQRLETAQETAHLGYWFYDRSIEKIYWAKELYIMLGLELTKPVPPFNEVMELVHEQDRQALINLINSAFNEGTSYELEARMRKFSDTDSYSWYHLIGKPIKNEEGQVNQISGIAMNIDQRKKIEIEVNLLHEQLITSARRAGMADVATATLHNVGNILNSANVSIGLITETINHAEFKKIEKLNLMMEEHVENLSSYLSGDPKGKLIPTYLVSLLKKIEYTHTQVILELTTLTNKLKNINEIVAMQNKIVTFSDMSEKIYVANIIDKAILMCGDMPTRNGISIVQDYYDNSLAINSYKDKLLQILYNLIQNAIEAFDNTNIEQKQIAIIVNNLANDKIEINIVDNGIGIPPENIIKIFSFGYTTKNEGHGFGLHSSALAAIDLSGKLEAKSAGTNKGAVFTLTLPINFATRSHIDEGNRQLSDYSY